MIRQGERRHEDRMHVREGVRIARDRLASQFDRLIVTLQIAISRRLAAVPNDELLIVLARPKRFVEIFKAFVEFPEAFVGEAQATVGVRNGRFHGERALEFGDGFLGAPLGPKDAALYVVRPTEIW